MHRYYCTACKLIYKYLKHGPPVRPRKFPVKFFLFFVFFKNINPRVSLKKKKVVLNITLYLF